MKPVLSYNQELCSIINFITSTLQDAFNAITHSNFLLPARSDGLTEHVISLKFNLSPPP